MSSRFMILMLVFLGIAVRSSAEQIKDGHEKANLPDSSVYEGEFKNRLFNGKGVLVWRNGAKYEGESRDGLINGKGVMVWRSGERYEGDLRMD